MRADGRNAEWYARLGEIYLFETDWISKAIDCFETAAHFAPDRLDYRWRLYFGPGEFADGDGRLDPVEALRGE